MPDLMELTPEVCARLLRSGVVARVAFCTADGPHIVPLNYAVVDDFVVFRTSPYSELGSFARSSLLALEVDHIDHEHGRGWSVVVRGRCEWVEDAATISRIEAVPASLPWASGSRHLYLRLPVANVSGRQLGRHWEPLDDLPGSGAVAGVEVP